MIHGISAADVGDAFVGSIRTVIKSPGFTADVQIDVPRVASEQRIVFSSLRSTARLKRIELRDSDGNTVWTGESPKILLLDRREAVSPGKGDVYLVGHLASVSPGPLFMRLTALEGQSGTVEAVYSVRPKLELFLPNTNHGQADGTVGSPMVVLVQPQDGGNPILGLRSIEVSLEDSTGLRIDSVLAVDTITTVLGVVLPLSPGHYIAKFSPTKPGRYRVKARVTLDQTVLLATRDITVSNQ